MTDRKWYSPAGAVCKVCALLGLKMLNDSAGPVFFFLYGAVDLLGVGEATKLVYRMVKANGNASKKNQKGSLSRVRNRS